MKLKATILSLALISGASAALACSDLIAGRKATTDGSVFATYAADSHTLYGELYHRAAADHAPGSMRKVTEWDTGKYMGEIPEIAHTYARMGNMNEHGLVITESTWGGRPELNGTGLIDYGSLIFLGLERAKTAREALKVMTDLVDKYGYASSGESFTIADADEVWIMELIGKGKTDKGAVWVARRVPDDCISGHANHARIHTFPLADKSGNTIYSKDVIDFARSQGYFNGKDKDFSFSRAYAPADMGALRGCDGRVWAFYNKYADGMDRYLPWILEGKGEPLPLWVKPNRKLAVRDMKDMMRDHFEDTPLDMTKDVGAGSYKVPYRWRPLTYKVDGSEYTHERAIATQQTGFSLVAQLRKDAPEAMKGVLWFGVDDANTSVYIPIYNSLTTVPHEFAEGNGDLLTFSWESAFWVTNFVANQAYHRYSQMIPDIRRVQTALEDSLENQVNSYYTTLASVPHAEAAATLNSHSCSATTDYVKKYRSLGEFLLVKYLDGNVKKMTPDGKFARTADGMPVSPDFPGYDENYYRSIVNDPAGGERLKVIEISND